MRQDYRSASEFQTAVAPSIKANAGFNVQVICDLARSTWSKHTYCSRVKGATIKFNVPRNCRTFHTRGFFFVELGMYPGSRLAIPIRRNTNWDRFSRLLGTGWTCKTYGLAPTLEIVAYLSKEDELLHPRINARNFAYTVLTSEGEILRQGYLGQQIWPKKHHFEERRAMLQSLNALKKPRRMRHRQRDYVETNIGQIVREIIGLAIKCEAGISIEKLSKFRPKGRRFNRKVMTIPLYLFRRILENRCFDNGITINRTDAYHTSKWCTHCGAVGRGHDGGNYSLFRCRECGRIVNSDREASLAVAVKTFLERNSYPNRVESFQISGRRVPVSGFVRRVSDATGPMAVPMRGR